MTLSVEEFKKRIDPDHLKTTQELKDDVIQTIEVHTESPNKKRVDDPRANKEFTFQFKWKDTAGKVWKGEFTNKILTIRDRQHVGITRAKLAGGLDYRSIDPLTEEINLITAHLMYSLTKTPEWAKDLMALEDVSLLQALYTEVASHEAYFFGYGSPASESQE